MITFNLKVLAKFGPCLSCSLKLHVEKCSFGRACKIFATACMLPHVKLLCHLQGIGKMLSPDICLISSCDHPVCFHSCLFLVGKSGLLVSLLNSRFCSPASWGACSGAIMLFSLLGKNHFVSLYPSVDKWII